MNLRHVAGTGQPPARLYGTSLPALLRLALLAILVAAPGCGGCWTKSPTTASAKKKADDKQDAKDKKDKTSDDELDDIVKKRTKKAEKPKDDFEPLLVRMLPSGDPAPNLKQQLVYVKPGHWSAVSQVAKTNNFDFPGELATFIERGSSNMPLEIENSTARMGSWTPAVLPKGQSKRIESLFYVPRNAHDLSGVYSLRSELHGVRGGRTEVFTTVLSQALKDYQHNIVVLAGGSVNASSYGHFDKLFSVRLPGVETAESETLRYYHICRPTIDRTAPLPSHALAWTTIAYVFWDDLDPGVLTNLQQQALLDWLHWGGQLVISGPNSLDKLKGSFLAPYLPGEATQSVKLDQAAFDELNQRFSLDRDPRRVAQLTKPPQDARLRRIRVIAERPMVGIDLKLHPAAREMAETGGLVVERRVGGGRIAVTRFPLTDVRIKQWKNFDGFFNSVLLRRPARVFRDDAPNQGDFVVASRIDVNWIDPNLHHMRLDARLGSTLRYFTRDAGALPGSSEAFWLPPAVPRAPPEEPAQQIIDPRSTKRRPGAPPQPTFNPMPYYGGPVTPPDTAAQHPGIDDWHFAGYGRSPIKNIADPNRLTDATGVAAWNDDSAASTAARDILKQAGGIEIPRADFVLKALAIYLLVLVPVNWLVFWTIGRVEWAWIAAPLIALGGAAGVVRLAQLDIGFARSRTEVAVLELQSGYERGHLTRYTSLYTSLSSSYTLAFEDPTALAAPFPAAKRNESLLNITSYTDVAFRRDKDTSLAGVQVSSNSTGMVHCEQMLPLGDNTPDVKTLRLEGDDTKGYVLRNTTSLAIRDVAILRRAAVPAGAAPPPTAPLETAYVARLEPNSTSSALRFSPLAQSPETEPPTTTRDPRTGMKLRDDSSYPTHVWLSEWNEAAIFAPTAKATDDGADAPRIRLEPLARLAANRLRLLPGDVRLIGWTDQRLPGMRIRPEAPQNTTYTLVLAHLVRGDLPPVRADGNVAEDYFSPTFDDPDVPVIVPAEVEM